MRIQQWPDDWQKLNTAVTESLAWNENQAELRVLPSVGVAVMEAIYGLRRLGKIKKKMFYLKNASPMFEVAATALAKEGLEVHGFDSEDLKSMDAFIEKLGRETLLVLYAVDDPVLGRKFDMQSLEAALSETSIFQVCVSHAAHLIDGLPKPHKNKLQILGTDADYALMGLGLRTKISHTGIEFQNWTNLTSVQVCSALQVKPQLRACIEEFENLELDSAKPLLKNMNRVWDRSVLAWTDVDGYSMVDRLAKIRGIELASAGQDSRFETMSLTRWGGLRGNDWLKAWGFSAEELRGTIIIDAKCIDQELPMQIKKAHAEILREQNGSH